MYFFYLKGPVSLSHLGHTSHKNRRFSTQFNTHKPKQKSHLNLLSQHKTQFNQSQQNQHIHAHNPKAIVRVLLTTTIIKIKNEAGEILLLLYPKYIHSVSINSHQKSGESINYVQPNHSNISYTHQYLEGDI